MSIDGTSKPCGGTALSCEDPAHMAPEAIQAQQCASVNDGDRCDLPAGHVGRHEHTESRQWEPETVAVEDLFPPRREQTS